MGCCHATSIGATPLPDGGDKQHRRRAQPAPTKQQQQQQHYEELSGQLPPDGGAPTPEKNTAPSAAARPLDPNDHHRDGRLLHFWHGLKLCHTSTQVAAVQTAALETGDAGGNHVQPAAHGRSDHPQRNGAGDSGERSACSSSSPSGPMASPCGPLVTLTPEEPEDFYDDPAAKAQQQQALPPSKWQFIFGGGRDTNPSVSAEGAYVASDSQQSPATARLTSELLVRAQAARESRVKELISTGRSVPEEELPPLNRNWRIECWMAAILKESASSSVGSYYSDNRGGTTGSASALAPQDCPPVAS